MTTENEDDGTMNYRTLAGSINRAQGVYLEFDSHPNDPDHDPLLLRIEKIAAKDIVADAKENGLRVKAHIDSDGDLVIEENLDEGGGDEDDDRTWEVDGETFDGDLETFFEQRDGVAEDVREAIDALEPGRAIKGKSGSDVFVIKRVT